MTRPLLLATAVVTLSIVLFLSPAAPGKSRPAKGAPKVTALVCTVDPEDEGGDNVGVVGGPRAGRGWLESEEAQGLMHKGDRLSLYSLDEGVIGSVVLTNKGKLPPEEEQDHAWGLRFDGASSISNGKRGEVRTLPSILTPWDPNNRLSTKLLAAWAPRSRQKPAWVVGKMLNPDNRVYHQTIERWLSAKGVPRAAIDNVAIFQIVRADINRDGRDEVFISFYSPDHLFPVPVDEKRPPSAGTYFLMRYLPPGAREPETVIIHGPDEMSVYWVDGFCDLDRDGWAEVVVGWAYYEGDGSELLHWTGRRFKAISGAGWGA